MLEPGQVCRVKANARDSVGSGLPAALAGAYVEVVRVLDEASLVLVQCGQLRVFLDPEDLESEG